MIEIPGSLCSSLGDEVTTPSSNHARFWASVSQQRARRSTECREKLTAELTARDPLKGPRGVVGCCTTNRLQTVRIRTPGRRAMECSPPFGPGEMRQCYEVEESAYSFPHFCTGG